MKLPIKKGVQDFLVLCYIVIPGFFSLEKNLKVQRSAEFPHPNIRPLFEPPTLHHSSHQSLDSAGQGHHHLHVVAGEEALLATERSLVPVFIDLVGQCDYVALVEAQLALVLRLKVVQSLAARLVIRVPFLTQ